MYRRATIERLAQSFITALQDLIGHCQSADARGYTPADFPHMNLSQQELDELLTALGESAEGN
jgi:non-ribosomal peptide synthase protein (TIGR01720 family)